MNTPIEIWHAEHAYFNRLLALLQKEVVRFHGGERPNYELMLDIVLYLRDYGDDMHHPREDAAFAILAERCPDLRLTLDKLAQEHRVIARAGATLAGQLGAALGGSIISRAEVEVAAATYLVYYGNHIAHEEEEVVARAAEVLTAEDWRVVGQAAEHHPVFRDRTEERYRRLRREIAREAVTG